MASKRILVLISGSGTNLQALIDAKIPDTEIVHVVSNRKDAYGLKRAEAAGIPTSYHNLLKYKKDHPRENDDDEAARRGYDGALAEIVLDKKPDLVVCAGWMHILSTAFLDPLEKARVAIINLHPALPGQFSGKDAIERAYGAFQQGEIVRTGIMIHYVISEVDMGETIVEREIPMIEGESLEDLKQRIHTFEWKAIVEGTAMAIQNLSSRKKQ